MRIIAYCVVLLLLHSSQANASWKKHLWRASLVALAAGSAADAHSSWGLYEANPVLRGPDGRFGHRGVGLKIGLASGIAVGQYFLMQRMAKQQPGYDRDKAYLYMSIGNFASGAAFAGVAKRNYGLR